MVTKFYIFDMEDDMDSNKNLVVELDSGKFELHPRNVPIDLNFINTALFIKNKKYSLMKKIVLPDKDITITGGQLLVTENNKSVIESFISKITSVKSKKEIKVGDLYELSVPGGLEQNIFFTIIKLMYEIKQKYNLPVLTQSIIIRYSDIYNIFKDNNKQVRIRDIRLALYKLSTATVHFTENSLLETNGDKIAKITHEGKFHYIDFEELKIEKFKLASNKVSEDEYTEEDLSLNEPASLSFGQFSKTGLVNYINSLSTRLDYVLKIKLNDFTYQNLIKNLTLWYSLPYLLSVDYVEQAMLIVLSSNLGKIIYKNGNYEEISQKNVIKIHITRFAASVPLSIDDKLIGVNLRRLCEGLDCLKSKKYILDYSFDSVRYKNETFFTVVFYPEQVNRNADSLTYGFDLKIASPEAICTTLDEARVVLSNSPLMLTNIENKFKPDNSLPDKSSGIELLAQSIETELSELYGLIEFKFKNNLAVNVKKLIEDMFIESRDKFTSVNVGDDVVQLELSNGNIFLNCLIKFIKNLKPETVDNVSGLVSWFLRDQSNKYFEEEVLNLQNILVKKNNKLKEKQKLEDKKNIEDAKLEKQKSNIVKNYNAFISAHTSIKFNNPDLFNLTLGKCSKVQNLEDLPIEELAIAACVCKTMSVSALNPVWDFYKLKFKPMILLKLKEFITNSKII